MNFIYYDSIPSTNSFLMEKGDNLPDGTVVMAKKQTAGRGRVGRSFFSPDETGIYESILIKDGANELKPGEITTAAALAAALSIERCTGKTAGIKWVNDVFVDGKKVCGILAETSLNPLDGSKRYIVVGAGFNVYEPKGGFPEEIAHIAGAITKERKEGLREKIAREFAKIFLDLLDGILYGKNEKKTGMDVYSEYVKRCFVCGMDVFVIRGDKKTPAKALSIDREYRLLVEYEDKRKESLDAGEVSIRPKEDE